MNARAEWRRRHDRVTDVKGAKRNIVTRPSTASRVNGTIARRVLVAKSNCHRRIGRRETRPYNWISRKIWSSRNYFGIDRLFLAQHGISYLMPGRFKANELALFQHFSFKQRIGTDFNFGANNLVLTTLDLISSRRIIVAYIRSHLAIQTSLRDRAISRWFL